MESISQFNLSTLQISKETIGTHKIENEIYGFFFNKFKVYYTVYFKQH